MKRFEELTLFQQLEALKKLHTLINEKLFDGELSAIPIGIYCLDNGCNAVFRRYCDENGNARYTKLIFDEVYIEVLLPAKDDDEQFESLFITMLHEMIHQYCHEHGIVDGDNLIDGHNVNYHSKEFQYIAWEHGLDEWYENGEVLEEDLRYSTFDVLEDIKKQLILNS